jgi:hypothetical protein
VKHRILPVIVYECQIWSQTLREGTTRLKVSENRVLRKIFGTKTEKAAGAWRNLHKDFHNVKHFTKYY